MGLLTTRQRVTDDGAAVVVQLCGELDLGGVEDAERALRAGDECAAQALLVDLRELRFLDSSGIGCLLRASSRARERGRPLVLVTEPTGMVQRVLELVGLEGQLQLRHDLDVILPEQETRTAPGAA